MYAIYKYVYKNEIIYIGKTNSSLKNRLICHRNESKFQPFLEADIFYFEVANKTETEIFEKLLINKYHPRLNVADNYEKSINIVFQEPQWIKIDEKDIPTHHFTPNRAACFAPKREVHESNLTSIDRLKKELEMVNQNVEFWKNQSDFWEQQSKSRDEYWEKQLEVWKACSNQFEIYCEEWENNSKFWENQFLQIKSKYINLQNEYEKLTQQNPQPNFWQKILKKLQ